MDIPPVARLETDRFCTECGYNLNTQAVWRDERLGILLCRCPECGRHHPAESNVTMAQDWLRRLTSIFATIWMIGVVIFLSLVMLVMTGFSLSLADGWQLARLETVLATGTRKDLLEFVATSMPAFVVLMIAAWTFVGVINLLASHIPARRLWLAALMPPAVAAGVILMFTDWSSPKPTSPAFWPMVGIVAVVTGGTAVAAFMLARPIWRGLALIVLPPKVRLAVAGLWTSGGRAVPGDSTLRRP